MLCVWGGCSTVPQWGALTGQCHAALGGELGPAVLCSTVPPQGVGARCWGYK